MSSSYQELVEPIRLEQCIKRRQQDRIAELEAQRDELLKIVKEGLDECWYSLAKERVDSIVAEVEARLADRPERCPDCEGSGSLGQARDGREIACELCDGDEEALGTGRLPSSNERRIEELETQLAASEQMRQDAEVGRAFINLFNSLRPGNTFSLGFTDEENDGVDVPKTYWVQLLEHNDVSGDDIPQYRNGIECYANEAPSWRAALVAAGLIKEEK